MNTKTRLIRDITLVAVTLTLLVFSAVLTGCGSGSSGNDESGGGILTVADGGNVEVHIKNNRFSPSGLKITKGMIVVWINDDSVQHTATAMNKSFDSGKIDPGQTYKHTFNEPGNFDYTCTIHPSMKGELEVH